MAGNSQELEQFVRDALMRGVARDNIRHALAGAGWDAEQVDTALDAYADVDFPVPVPRPRPQLSARDAFLYLVLFTTLYISAYQLGDLLFDLVNLALPDAAARGYGSGTFIGMRRSMAAIIIAFPVFLLLSARIGRELRRQPAKRLSPVRRWLTYLTLFIAAMVLICDLIALVDHFLGGELTARFVLKVVIAAAIAGSIFGYYLRDLHRDEAVS